MTHTSRQGAHEAPHGSFKKLLGSDTSSAEVRRIADEIMHKIEAEKKAKTD